MAILVVGALLAYDDLPDDVADAPVIEADGSDPAPSPSTTSPSATALPTPSPTPTPSPKPPRAPQSPTPTPTPTSNSTPAPPAAAPRGDDALVLRTARVVGVVDGDTVDLDDGTRVRLAIVDTPEVHGGVEPCGREASAFTREFVLGVDVTVLRPSSAPVTDTYGRLVGEVVRVADGWSLNVALAAAGLARVDERFTSEDPDLAERARAAVADAATPPCAGPQPEPSDQPATVGGHTGRTDGGWSCHTAYRECLPAHVPDLDCADIGHQVVLRGDQDPWRLDGSSTSRDDGLGCASYPPWSASQVYPYE